MPQSADDEVGNSWSFSGKLLPHAADSGAAQRTGHYLSLRDSQIKRLARNKTLFKYSAKIVKKERQ